MFPRHLSRAAIVQGLALTLIAGAASAAVSLAYTSSSQATLGVVGPPVVWVAGGDAAVSAYVPSFSLSTNQTTFTTTLRGVPEATVTLSDLVRIRNADSAAHDVTLSSANVANAYVIAYRLDFFDGATFVGTLDFKAASPTVTLASMPAGATYTAKATIQLASGAGANNVADARSIDMRIS